MTAEGAERSIGVDHAEHTWPPSFIGALRSDLGAGDGWACIPAPHSTGCLALGAHTERPLPGPGDRLGPILGAGTPVAHASVCRNKAIPELGAVRTQ